MADPEPQAPRTTVRRTDTSDPHASRVRALKILFQADVRGVPAGQTLGRLEDDPAARAILDDGDAEVMGQMGQAEQLPGQQATDAGPEDRTVAAAREAAERVPRIDGFTRTLVLGVADALPELDVLISRYARRWQISRMPVVDRSVLRLATYELLFEATPPAVIIDEAVSLAKSLSTDDSGRYVNGVLESIRKEVAARPARSSEPDADPAPDIDAAPDAEGG